MPWGFNAQISSGRLSGPVESGQRCDNPVSQPVTAAGDAEVGDPTAILDTDKEERFTIVE